MTQVEHDYNVIKVLYEMTLDANFNMNMYVYSFVKTQNAFTKLILRLTYIIKFK